VDKFHLKAVEEEKETLVETQVKAESRVIPTTLS
jgi:hypothetical protein